LVVTVIITDFPRSPLAGVNVNEKGDALADVGLNLPVPFEVNVTFVALPPKVFPDMVTGVTPHVFPPKLLSVTVGPFTHCPNVTVEKNIKRNTKKKALVIIYITNLT
jgi:hypothetical protein